MPSLQTFSSLCNFEKKINIPQVVYFKQTPEIQAIVSTTEKNMYGKLSKASVSIKLCLEKELIMQGLWGKCYTAEDDTVSLADIMGENVATKPFDVPVWQWKDICIRLFAKQHIQQSRAKFKSIIFPMGGAFDA